MRLYLLLPILCLPACERVGGNPWAHLDYAEANCGTKSAVLTTTGCNIAPVANPVTALIPVKDPNSEEVMAERDNDASAGLFTDPSSINTTTYRNTESTGIYGQGTNTSTDQAPTSDHSHSHK